MNEYHEQQERLIKYNSSILILKWSQTLNWSQNSIGVEHSMGVENSIRVETSNIVEKSIGIKYFCFLFQRS
jgi:hypothetical protein